MNKENVKDSRKDIFSVLHFYYLTTSLKEKIRQGWIYWKVSDTRLESIAEHIYGTQMLAISIYSAFNLDIDIAKVIMMLALHETEEIKIGDITPFDNVSDAEKLVIGDVAVNEIFATIKNSQDYIDLITEFNAHETPESLFAYLCDKLECDLQAKKYSDRDKCHIYGAVEQINSDDRVQEIINNGAYSVFQVFAGIDSDKYTGTIFESILDFADKFSIPTE